jgi:hypothetical protein
VNNDLMFIWLAWAVGPIHSRPVQNKILLDRVVPSTPT